MSEIAASSWHVGLVGYGEVGRILAEDLRGRGVGVSAFDLKLASSTGNTPLSAASDWPRAMQHWPPGST
jgi:phosphoglycerate dehydrogenase-like enzyme